MTKISENSSTELEVNFKLKSKNMKLKEPQVKLMSHVIRARMLSNKIQIKSKQRKTCPSPHARL